MQARCRGPRHERFLTAASALATGLGPPLPRGDRRRRFFLLYLLRAFFASFALSATWLRPRAVHTPLGLSSASLLFSARVRDRSSVRNSTSHSPASSFLRALPGAHPGFQVSSSSPSSSSSSHSSHSSVLRENQYLLPHRRHTCSLSHSETLYFPRLVCRGTHSRNLTRQLIRWELSAFKE